MENLRRLCLALVLCAAFALPAFAGEMPAPPCANPGDISGPPGEQNGPPCMAPGETQGPGFATSTEAGEPDVGQTGLAASLILFALGGGL